jgi:outer membrane immunogenic protein
MVRVYVEVLRMGVNIWPRDWHGEGSYMRKEHSIVLRSFCSTALAVSMFCGVAFNAQAADMYRGSLKDSPEYLPVLPAWGGLYLGGHIGGAWGDVGVTDTYYYHEDPTVGSSIGASGVIGGGQIGYNLQSGHVVYGVEVDLGGMDLSGSNTVQLQGGREPLSARYSISSGFYGDFTGRLGFASGRALFYAKGGAAFLNADFNSHYTGRFAEFDFSNSDTLWGWTIGGGVEYKLSPSWSIKAEYQHFDFGDASFANEASKPTRWGCCADLTSNAKVSPTADAVTVGVNYFLNQSSGQIK